MNTQERIFSQGIEVDPTSARLRCNRCAALLRLGRADEAATDAQTACELDPNLGQAWTRRVTALTAAGRHEEAVECGRGAVLRFPGDVALAGALTRAETAVAERAVTGGVVDFAVHKTLGAAAVSASEYAAAEASYTKSLEAMEAVLQHVPRDQAAQLQERIRELKEKMRSELRSAAAPR
jgi:tetratricopeptide (TPR) repeat protein